MGILIKQKYSQTYPIWINPVKILLNFQFQQAGSPTVVVLVVIRIYGQESMQKHRHQDEMKIHYKTFF